MPSASVSYHWADSPNLVFGPQTNTEYHNDITLPAGHTLRRILNAEPQFYWKRGSVSSDDQELYFVSMRVQYGAAEGAPILYRAMRTMKSQYIVNAAGLADVYLGFHSGAELELGFNERVQRGGFYSPEQRLRLSWSIGSSGSGGEILVGGASIDFRALYSLPILP